METVKVCVYCGNETTADYCHNCMEYDGLVECIVVNGEYVEVENERLL